MATTGRCRNPVAPVVSAPRADHGEGPDSATGESVSAPGSAIGGPISAPSTAHVRGCPTDRRRASSLATPAPTPRMSTETAALVPHRPPLAVRWASARRLRLRHPCSGCPFPTRSMRRPVREAMRRQPSSGWRQHPARPSLIDSPRARSPTRARCGRCSIERPMGPGLVPTGGATRQMDPIPVQRRATGQLAVPAANPQTILAGRSGEHASATSQTIGQAQSFATMFASRLGAGRRGARGQSRLHHRPAADRRRAVRRHTTSGRTDRWSDAQRQVETAAPRRRLPPLPPARPAPPAGGH